MIKASFLNSQKLPLVVGPEDNLQNRADFQLLKDTLLSEGDYLREQLLIRGAILLRGYNLSAAGELEALVSGFSETELFNYAGGASPRKHLGGGVYNSTEYPPNLGLRLHNELSYSESFPHHLYFCCLTAPEKGGETTLGDSRRILREINPKIIELFKQKKIRYDRCLSAEKGSGYSWQEAFETDEPEIAENCCRKISAQFRWKENGSLHISQIRPATVVHPETGEEVWFNQAESFHPSSLDEETYNALIAEMPEEDFRLNAHFGDGSPLCRLMLNHIREVLQKETILLRWQTGDVLIVDNLLSAHGRMPFSGARKIALAMT